MKTFKIEVEVVLADDANPNFLFAAISDLLEEGESMTVARYMDVNDTVDAE